MQLMQSNATNATNTTNATNATNVTNGYPLTQACGRCRTTVLQPWRWCAIRSEKAHNVVGTLSNGGTLRTGDSHHDIASGRCKYDNPTLTPKLM
jgi:hypothetical protein